MKKGIMLFAFGLISLSLQSQKIIEKNIDYNNQVIDVEVKFASDIQVKTWDKQTVYFKADIQTEDGEHLDLYTLNVEENTNSINISSDSKALFKFYHDQWNKNRAEDDRRYYHTGKWYEFSYVLYVPKNAIFTVSSINGDLDAEIIEGNFTADLINGNIAIKKYNGNLDLRTINGEIDLVMANSRLIAETIHGNIYADENLKLKVTDRYVGQKVEGSFDGAKNRLRLNTINGNMYLRL